LAGVDFIDENGGGPGAHCANLSRQKNSNSHFAPAKADARHALISGQTA